MILLLFLAIHACVFSKQAVGKPFPHLVLPNINRVSLPAQITLNMGTEGAIVTCPVIDEPRVTADLCPEGRAILKTNLALGNFPVKSAERVFHGALCKP